MSWAAKLYIRHFFFFFFVDIALDDKLLFLSDVAILTLAYIFAWSFLIEGLPNFLLFGFRKFDFIG
jgi:hypothetical protein